MRREFVLCVCRVLLLLMFVVRMRVDVALYYKGFSFSLDLLLARATIVGFLSWSLWIPKKCPLWDIM